MTSTVLDESLSMLNQSSVWRIITPHYTNYKVIEQPIGKMSVFKIKSMEGDDKIKVVHWNLLLPLFSYHTNVLDMESMADQTVNAHGITAACAVIIHVQTMGAYSRAQVTNLFQQGLQFVTALFLSSVKHYGLIDSIISWI